MKWISKLRCALKLHEEGRFIYRHGDLVVKRCVRCGKNYVRKDY